MRAVIISEIEGVFKKIVWIEECRGGVYVGLYGKANKIHYSYHQDGSVHVKYGSRYLPMYKTTAINDIQKFISITGYGITLEKGYEFATEDYIKNKKSNSVIYINPKIIKRQKIINIIPCIVRNGFEKACINHYHKSYQGKEAQTFELINANFFKLEKFQGFLVGIILSGGKYQ
jgi:hypothetical protein